VDELGKRPEELAATLAQAYDDTVEALGSALELKDVETYGHCQRVTAFTISIAKAVPVPSSYLRSWLALHSSTTSARWRLRTRFCANQDIRPITKSK